MDKLQIIILISLISISTFAWIISKDQPDMMKAMMTLDPALILLFTAELDCGNDCNDVSCNFSYGFII